MKLKVGYNKTTPQENKSIAHTNNFLKELKMFNFFGLFILFNFFNILCSKELQKSKKY